jgi:glycosyltransferase involved in cell wall biosynthesis
MRISVDATPIREKPSGIGIYCLNLIKALSLLQFQENFEIDVVYQPSLKKWLFGDLSFPDLLNTTDKINRLPLPVTLTSLLAKFPNFVLPYFEKSLNSPDIVHGTDHFVYPCRHSLRVMTIHDLTFIKYPNYATSIVKSYSNRVKQCLKWTDLIITFSQNTKKDIVSFLNFNPDRIFVTPQASRYSPNYLSPERLEQLKKENQYDFDRPYILFVSKLEPRKNILTLIEAFNSLKKNYKIEHQLILIGQKGWKYEPIINAIATSPHTDSIHHLDYLSDELVALFYSQADVFVYPSYYEGFGLPVLEAMTLGAPVITSNTSSLPEVAGDAAIPIDPHDSSELAGAILKVISNSQLRQNLIEKGKERAKLFSWEKTAIETLKAYRTLI